MTHTSPHPSSVPLALRGLSYRFNGASDRPPAECHFPDLTLAPHQHLLLRGASGAGKSTLLALMAGLLSPHRGSVRIHGVDMAELPTRKRDAWRGATLGFMPQRLHLSPHLSVRDNLKLAYLCAGIPADQPRIESVLASLGIVSLADRQPYQLSVGQAQRVALARALLRRPQFILADEPSANLDDAHTATSLALMQAAAAENAATLIVATHDARVCQAFPQAQVLTLQPIAPGAHA